MAGGVPGFGVDVLIPVENRVGIATTLDGGKHSANLI